MKVLIISHGHPNNSLGGAELAAYNLFNELKCQIGSEAHFLAIQSQDYASTPHELAHSETFNEHSITSNSDPFDYTNQNPDQCWNRLKSIVSQIQPDIIHLHHFLHIGVDSIQILQQFAPTAKICLTLHDYRALCLNDGLMITHHEHQLCSESSPDNCHKCDPIRTRDAIKQRHKLFHEALNFCDALISPSRFLADQFRNNGINHRCLRSIGNGLSQAKHTLKQSQALNRFGFFGKTTEAKGIHVLLQAIWRLQSQSKNAFEIEIFGDGLAQQPAAFQHRIANLLEGKISPFIRWHGGYKPEEIPTLMQRIDWVVMPSIWWENAPLVIQESFAFQRPVIGSGIGGILESIDQQGGICFSAGDADDLATVMAEAISNEKLHRCLQNQMEQPFSIEACAAQHLDFYKELMQNHACG